MGAAHAHPEDGATVEAKVSPLDMAELENCSLRCENLRLEMELLEKDLLRARERMGQAQSALMEKRRVIEKTYGKSLSTHRLLKDGTFQPIQPKAAQ